MSKNQQNDALEDSFRFFLEKGSKEETINIATLGEIMKKFGETPTDAELREMIREVDHNGDGSIDFEEFQFLNDSLGKKIDEKVEIAESFKLFSTDGRMYAKNIQTVFENLGLPVTEEESQHMILENSSNPNATFLTLQDWAVLFKRKISCRQ